MKMHKFKLKKKGKAVGYENHALLYPDNYIVILHSEHNNWAEMGCYNILIHPKRFIFHDEKCTLVCKDKNDKDVFAGDTIKMLNPSTEAWIDGLIVLPNDLLAPYIRAEGMDWDIRNEIELLEERNESQKKPKVKEF